ncbi:UDP-N-acetylmuramoyl-L-alanine--D-glutamate ligase [Patescibacteria group bacterium]|nr:UDP-N-acetylmuramoyl-L-alanine--D-glutamate ligase [Patescibacteria group bacterium]MBU1922228.1 UDP-N-acetylmuramoyl-L-alanine--D-glutamate ligase [Patescibacteria group bacterium]
MKFPEYKNKKVLIAGLGLYRQGSGISAAKFFVKNGARVTVTDLKTRRELASSLRELKSYKITYVLGKHRKQDFKDTDIVVKNPGMRRNSSYIATARKAGVRIESDITIFFKHCPARIIGVTGTRGKSTTAAFIYEMLKKKKTAFLGGNIKVSPLNFLGRIKSSDWAVIELSSWMLEDLGDKKTSPHIAVVTNVMRDHLNAYPNMRAYERAKAMIFKYQSPEDYVVLNRDNKVTREFGKRVLSQRFWFSSKLFKEENGAMARAGRVIFRDDGRVWNVAARKDILLLGEHNLYNALAATCVAKILRVPCATVRSALKSFKGLESRQQLIAIKQGIKYYNDTTATTPDAGMAALKTLGRGKNIILIAGGADKKLIFKDWARQVKKYTKAAILFKGAASKKMAKELAKNKVNITGQVGSMPKAVKLARDCAKRGDIVLLSPAAASFGLFLNEFNRGDRFVRAVRAVR